MSAQTIASQYAAAIQMAGLNNGLLNFEIAKKAPDLDALFEYADKLRDAVATMRILDDILKRQTEADALAANKNELEKVANSANRIYWDLHALLHGAQLCAGQHDGDGIELPALIEMASIKALEMQTCFNPYIQTDSKAEK